MSKIGNHKRAILSALASAAAVGLTSMELDDKFATSLIKPRKAHKALPEMEKAGLVARAQAIREGAQVWVLPEFAPVEDVGTTMKAVDREFMAEINGVMDKVADQAKQDTSGLMPLPPALNAIF